MFNVLSANSMELSGSLIFRSAGQKLHFKNGPNASFGTATLSVGSINVPTTAVTANSVIFLADQTPLGTLGILGLGGIRAGSGFSILSSNILDVSNVGWLMIEPSP
jgi:hypothetical protein